MQSSVSFFIPGIPAPQGSKIPVKRGSKVVLIEASKGFKPWRDASSLAALTARNKHFVFFETAVRVSLMFVLWKPPTTKYVDYPAGKPDLDKLARNTNDGLTGNIIKDDSLIVDLRLVKRWAVDGEPTGCWVEIVTV